MHVRRERVRRADVFFPKSVERRAHLLKQQLGAVEAKAMTARSNKRFSSDRSSVADVCLLLRAHAESRWLSNQLAPVLREVEERESISEEQLATALAYLEVLWIEACARARETESARVELDALGSGDRALYEKAHRYHAAVRRLRDGIEQRVARLIAVPSDAHVPPTLAQRPIRRRSLRGRPLRDRPRES
jgi:hypothetical protein